MTVALLAAVAGASLVAFLSRPVGKGEGIRIGETYVILGPNAIWPTPMQLERHSLLLAMEKVASEGDLLERSPLDLESSKYLFGNVIPLGSGSAVRVTGRGETKFGFPYVMVIVERGEPSSLSRRRATGDVGYIHHDVFEATARPVSR